MRRLPRRPPACVTPPPDCEAALCVIASGSMGNCSVLVVGRGASRRVILIDAGITPRAVWRAFEGLGLGASRLSGVVLTHLDHDHWKRSWRRAAPRQVPVLIHRRHLRRAERQNSLPLRTEPFDGEFEVAGVRGRSLLLSHDDLGVAAFRFDLPCGASLGYATDLGRATPELVDLLRGTDVLAIESNYCPRLQVASSRPESLKSRIMGGKGHLSNQQSARAAAAIGPRGGVVLLHLSRQCNTPALAMEAHGGGGYALTIADQFEPTPWVAIEPGPRVAGEGGAGRVRAFQPMLFAGC